MWSVNKDEGFATGPSEELSRGGVRVELAAFWTAEDGVLVSVEAYETPIPAALAADVAAAMARLAATPAPVPDAT